MDRETLRNMMFAYPHTFAHYVSGGDFQMYNYIKMISKKIVELINNGGGKLIVETGPRHGKKIVNSEKVLTPKGWVTHGDLKAGDYVYHPSGKAIKVLGTSSRSMCDMEVSFSNGQKIRCHKQHEWNVCNKNSVIYRTLETQQILENGIVIKEKKKGRIKNRFKYFLPFTDCLHYEEKKLDLHPYFLGFWLGDGTYSSPTLTVDPKQESLIVKTIKERCGYKTSSIYKHNKTGVPRLHFGFQNIMKKIRKLNLFKNKHIPEIYLRSSKEQRLELLAGLIDSDGYVCVKTGRVMFSTTNINLRDQTIDLVNGLGFKAYFTTTKACTSSSGIVGKLDVHQVGFNPLCNIPTAIPSKKIWKTNFVRRRVSITDIRKIDKPELGQCIQVDSPDGLYLVGEKLIPTHNSYFISQWLPIWFLETYPQKRVIISTYAADFARDWGRKVRNEFQRNELLSTKIDQTASRADSWSTTEGGACYTAGVGGQITGKGGHLCLVGKTKVRLKTGAVKNIENIKVGDMVLSYNHYTGRPEYKKVTHKFSKKTKQLVEIMACGRRKVTSTLDHKFYVPNRGYVQAEHLKIGDKLNLNFNDTWGRRDGVNYYSSKVTSVIKFSSKKEIDVYDITVEDNHNFYAEDILVHNCIIDDPVKNWDEASSATMRQRNVNWMKTTLLTRGEPGVVYIILMTRWHEQDLAGVMQKEDNWDVLRFPAIAEEDDILGRSVGEALNPKRYPIEKLLELKSSLGSKFFNAMFQQRPSPDEGDIFKRHWWRYYNQDELPKNFDAMCQTWDMAFKDTKGSAYVVGQVWGRHGANYYLLDQIRDKLSFTESCKAVERLSEKWPHVSAKLIEEKANGAAIIDTLKNKVSGIIPINPKGSKESRAFASQPLAEAGNIHVPNPDKNAWVQEFIEECCTFPNSDYKDQVDAMTQGLDYLKEKNKLKDINIVGFGKGSRWSV